MDDFYSDFSYDSSFDSRRRELIGKALQGDAEACYQLAQLYATQHCCGRSDQVQWLKEAAARGHSRAMNELGMIHTLPTCERAHYLLEASKAGLADATYNLGCFHIIGRGVPLSSCDAFKRFHQAAEAGLPEAMFALYKCYKHGFGVCVDLHKAHNWLEKAAYAQQIYAKCEFGTLLATDPERFDPQAAFKWLVDGLDQLLIWMDPPPLAAQYYDQLSPRLIHKIEDLPSLDRIDNPTMALFAGLYFQSFDHRLDRVVAYYDKAASLGCTEAYFHKALLLLGNHQIEQEPTEASDLLKRSVDIGLPQAMYSLGRCFFQGQRCKKDHALAKHWLSKAAEGGDKRALCTLGQLALAAPDFDPQDSPLLSQLLDLWRDNRDTPMAPQTNHAPVKMAMAGQLRTFVENHGEMLL